MFEKIQRILAKQMEVSPEEITMDTNIIDDLGADSLDLVELIVAIEEEEGIVITEERVNELKTVREVVDFVQKSI
ncbi:acyl carrier protein [Clostridiaceae bacterium OttesenSCG-928-D20]|nr:acyl carrier protein [Clostridiaceae bacterium OttesenSCG-928-D20]